MSEKYKRFHTTNIFGAAFKKFNENNKMQPISGKSGLSWMRKETQPLNTLDSSSRTLFNCGLLTF